MAKVNTEALGSGIVRGIHLGMDIDNHKANQEARARQSTLDDLELTMRKMQLNQLKDGAVREQTKRDLQSTLFYLQEVQEGGEGKIQEIMRDPERSKQLQQAIKNTGNLLVNRGAPADGMTRNFRRMVPLDENHFAVDLDVTRPDGTTYTAPVTKNRSADPNDPVQVFNKDQVFGELAKIDAFIDMYEAELVRLGDTGPIERKAASRAEKGKRDWEKEKLGIEHGYRMEELGLKDGKGADKVPDYEKQIRKISAEAFGSSLGDQFSFEGDNADKAAVLSQQTLDIYLAMPEESRSVIEAHNQALAQFRQGGGPISMEDATKRATEEASDKAGLWSSKSDFGGSSEEDWIKERTGQIFEESRGGMGTGLPTRTQTTGTGQGTQGSKEAPFQPKDKAAFDQLPSGSWYISPANGKPYRKQ